MAICEKHERLDSYLYADCQGRTVNLDGTKTCRIGYGETLDINIFFYKPYPYMASIEFAADGTKGVLPTEFDINVGAEASSGTLHLEAKHQVLIDSDAKDCHTTESDPVENPTGADPGSIWGLALDIPEAPRDGFVIKQGLTFTSENYPYELAIITEGNGRGWVAGVDVPCWYQIEQIAR